MSDDTQVVRFLVTYNGEEEHGNGVSSRDYERVCDSLDELGYLLDRAAEDNARAEIWYNSNYSGSSGRRPFRPPNHGFQVFTITPVESPSKEALAEKLRAKTLERVANVELAAVRASEKAAEAKRVAELAELVRLSAKYRDDHGSNG